MSQTRLQDLPIPRDTTNIPARLARHGFSLPFPSIPSSFADRNRRFHPYPLNATPSSLFHVALNLCTVPGYRFIRKNDQRQMLMFCDGACSNNGTNEDGRVQALGGCGVVFTCNEVGQGIKLALENDGTTHTSNRAELRAIILGLGLRYWPGEGFESLVIATDSEYVVLGITERIHRWIENGWMTAEGRPVANKDLWEELLEKVRELEEGGCHVQFWQIPREWNEADKYAKEATSVSMQDRDLTTRKVMWLGDMK
ncbi:ribonuclease H-like domain-containing protein [Kalaharituber pfeilii]|nr:ribonuclease H-like domain-containing protein [Kalaharituber pfeilii]